MIFSVPKATILADGFPIEKLALSFEQTAGFSLTCARPIWYKGTWRLELSVPTVEV
jgi:hypothetical protein